MITLGATSIDPRDSAESAPTDASKEAASAETTRTRFPTSFIGPGYKKTSSILRSVAEYYAAVRQRTTLALIAIFSLLVLAPVADGRCIKRHSVKVAAGKAPNGWAWTVSGTIGNNGNNCREWLFGMDFELEGAGNWGSSTGIPAGGHFGRRADISAFDTLLEDGSSRVFTGFVNGEVAKVVLTLSNNQHLAIRPKSPPKKLRQKVVWLRNVRYFVEYYPPVGFVTGVATLSASGQLLYRDKTFDGF